MTSKNPEGIRPGDSVVNTQTGLEGKAVRHTPEGWIVRRPDRLAAVWKDDEIKKAGSVY